MELISNLVDHELASGILCQYTLYVLWKLIIFWSEYVCEFGSRDTVVGIATG